MASRTDGNTVFLTEQEVERIRSTVKDRAKKCSEQAGQAREPRDAKADISQATGMALMADMGEAAFDLGQEKPKDNTLPALGVGQLYPPSILPLRDLEPMRLADLQMETHHRGRRLTIKRASPVVTLAARSWTVVQEDEGEQTERLEVCLHKSRHGKEVLESGSLFVIKEPYFTLTDQGEATLRIDHPTDLVVWRDETAKPGEESTAAEDPAAATDAAKKYKDKGNAALGKGDLPLAHARYTEGLRIAKQDSVFNSAPDVARDLSRNRAHVNLALNQLDEAVTDGKASLIGVDDERSKELDSKAYFRAGCAAYNLGNYQEARACFEARDKLTPNNKETAAYLKQISIRLQEQENGKYNWKKLGAGASRARPRVDAASFVGNAEIKKSAGRGRGLFAVRAIPAGEVIMCEKAFCVVWGHESESLTAMTYDVRDDRIRVAPVGLTKAVVQKLLNNPSQIEKVMDLFGDYQGEGKNISHTDDGPVVDVFRVHDIVSRNAFGPGSQYGDEDASHASTGLWVRAAYINHACMANAKKEYVGDLMILRAIRPIAAGEELFHSYDESSDYDARQAALQTTWGFECKCALCAVEKADDAAVRKKRRELAAEADTFVGREPWANARRLVVIKAQRLARSIDETYDAKRYKDMPRLATQRIQEWLAKADPRR
ncbi:tetratricopeptide [Thozetella sp. PMI_491]|nr:tetratricopeptide [Thozetella sp. PMI_491]